MAGKLTCCFNAVSKEFEGSLESVSRVFQEKVKRCFKKDGRVFQGNFKLLSRVFDSRDGRFALRKVEAGLYRF